MYCFAALVLFVSLSSALPVAPRLGRGGAFTPSLSPNMTDCAVCELLVHDGYYVHTGNRSLTLTDYTTSVASSNVLWNICQQSGFQTANLANVTCVQDVLVYNATLADWIFNSFFPPFVLPLFTCKMVSQC
jgi:hypothetical protein